MKNKLLFLLVGGVIGAVAVFLFSQVNFGGQSGLSFDAFPGVNVSVSKTKASGSKSSEKVAEFINKCEARGGFIAEAGAPDGRPLLLCIRGKRVIGSILV